MALFGDAVADCKRIEAAVHAFADRCRAEPPADMPDCDAVVAGAIDDGQAAECEAALGALACPTGRVALPDACTMDLLAP